MISLIEFLDTFPDQAACIAHLEAVRWPKGPVCDNCGEIDNALPLQRPGYWHCRACRKANVEARLADMFAAHGKRMRYRECVR